MEVNFYGANCVRITTKKASIIIDDNLEKLGKKPVTKKEDIVLKTYSFKQAAKDAKIVIDTPGEFEVSGTSIMGLAAKGHMEEGKAQSHIMYKLIVGEIRIAVVGHIYPELDEEQLEALGTVDVLIVPVGGHGYTLDAVGASKIIKNVDPKVVIPTHYADNDLAYEVPQSSLEDALKDLPFEEYETVDKYKLKSKDLPEVAKMVVITS